MRLNKFLAQATGESRRQADYMVEHGRVKINGELAIVGKDIGENDIVAVDDREVKIQEYQYMLFHKPVGYVCSRKMQGDSMTIYHLIPNNLHHLKAVGRLDKDSSGVMLLTNDGDQAHRMLHPTFHKTKTYEVELNVDLTDGARDKIISGVRLDDGISRLSLEGSGKKWTVSMHEGRNRQIRRSFRAVGTTVIALHRTEFGPLKIGNLKDGEYKMIATPDNT